VCVAELVGAGDRDQVWCGADWNSWEGVDDEVTSGLVDWGEKHLLPIENAESTTRAP